jgi:hypothetical protein
VPLNLSPRGFVYGDCGARHTRPVALLRFTASRRLLAYAVLACALLAGLGARAGSARAACVDVSAAYPGDGAAKNDVAVWMAGGAARAGLPPELPVMAALVESGLTNLQTGDGDAVGYFGMRLSIWNGGQYAGYATNPPLQLQWFVDQALKLVNGRAADESRWGDWIADVEQAPEQRRGLYQLQLGAARERIAAGCAAATPPGQPPPIVPSPDPTAPAPGGSAPTPAAGPTPPADTTAPSLTASAARRQLIFASHALTATATCPAETCSATLSARITGQGLAKARTLTGTPRTLAAGQRVRLRLAVGAALRRTARRAATRGHPLRAAIAVRVTDTHGNATTKTFRASLVLR